MDYLTNLVKKWIDYFWPPPRKVIFGRKPLDGGYGLAHHWAIKVGKLWYEIEGNSVKEKGTANSIAVSDGKTSKYGAEHCHVSIINETVIKDWKSQYCQNGFILVLLTMLFTGPLWLSSCFLTVTLFLKRIFKKKKSECIEIIGTTERTDEEIKEFNETFLENNPTYNVLTRNCQDYATAFAEFLMVKGERKGWLPKVESPINKNVRYWPKNNKFFDWIWRFLRKKNWCESFHFIIALARQKINQKTC